MPDMSAYSRTYHNIYEPYRRRKLRTATVRLNRIATYVSSIRPKLLDVGCSLGATVEGAVRRGWDAHGVDVSADAVAYCLDRGLSCTTTRGLRLPYPDATFDVVTAWHVIEHVPNVTETLREWRRVLKPGGLLVMETPDTDCIKVKLRGATYRRYWKAEHIYAFTRDNFVPFLEKTRFEILPYPYFGRLNDLTSGMAAYAFTYQSLKGRHASNKNEQGLSSVLPTTADSGRIARTL